MGSDWWPAAAGKQNVLFHSMHANIMTCCAGAESPRSEDADMFKHEHITAADKDALVDPDDVLAGTR